jgi:hypothetical protein
VKNALEERVVKKEKELNMNDEDFLNFGKWKIRKCCDRLAPGIYRDHDGYAMIDGTLFVGDYDEDGNYDEYEMMYCPGCGKRLEYYQ